MVSLRAPGQHDTAAQGERPCYFESCISKPWATPPIDAWFTKTSVSQPCRGESPIMGRYHILQHPPALNQTSTRPHRRIAAPHQVARCDLAADRDGHEGAKHPQGNRIWYGWYGGILFVKEMFSIPSMLLSDARDQLLVLIILQAARLL